MDVSNIVTQVATAVGIAQAIEAVPGGFDVPVDSSAELYTLLNGLATVHPVTQKDDEALPSIVYNLTGVDALDLNGYRITQTDVYVLSVRTADYDSLVTLVNSCIAAFRTSSYSIEPIDMAHGFDTEIEAYRCEIEVEFSYPVDASGGPSGAFSSELPLAIVYPIGRSANESVADNLTKQVVTNQYAIVVATTGDISTSLDAIQAVLLGYEQASGFWDVEYVSGSNLGGVGSMKLWQEVYQDRQIITEA